MAKKIKITKRDMKEDSFVTFMLQTKDFLLERWVYFIGGVALVVVVIVALSIMQSERGKNEKEAADVYSRAMSSYLQRNYQVAIIDFQSILDNYGSTSSAPAARFNLGNAYFGVKNYTEAITAFETYLRKYGDDKVFASSALAGIGASLAGNGDLRGAADKYREAAEKFPDFPLAGEYYLMAMKYYIKAGETESARVIFARLAKDYENTTYFVESQRIAGENNISL